MAEPTTKRVRTTPRVSAAAGTTAETTGTTTPTAFENLHTLGRLIQRSVDAAQRSAAPTPRPQRTPTTRTPTVPTPRPRDTPGTAPRTPGTARRRAPTTPHAIRALALRRAAQTPGRRRSGRGGRETPRDDLRALSRVLAGRTARVESPANPSARRRSRLDVGEVPSPPGRAPRMSMPVEEEEEGSWFEEGEGPRLREEDVEEGRRAALLEERRQSGLTGDLALRDSPETDGEPTFVFRIPEQRRITGPRSSLAAAAARQFLDVETGADETDADEEEGDEADEADEAEEAGEREEAEVIYGIPDLDDVAGNDDDDDEDIQVHDPSIPLGSSPPVEAQAAAERGAQPAQLKHAKRKRKELQISKWGIEFPSLPAAVIKKVATTFARSAGGSGKLTAETVAALSQTSDWFFEQIAEDLAVYADHAGRKTVEEADVVTLMKRQRLLAPGATPFSLAQKYLPRELLQEVRIAPKAKKRKLATIQEDDDE
ncbi:hypothetical protein EJ06DRAFT_523900 [Trichodelitschia bisporula]|uniref:CENP-T/Histone H4 histone fold domain-containing protein n=1 Tax=Trichodelitschia bisporula TaxID=703511 RepID=A0A6G1HN49_9PEZI|nr:hypothetical protein EJ06DRAFT_523900 [Trichodelitschia bisporula]